MNNIALNGLGDAALVSAGGGIYCTGAPTLSVVIRDNTLRLNTAAPFWVGEGGGMYLRGLVAPALVSGNTVEENVAGFNDDGSGGGIYVGDSEVVIEHNRIFENAASWAGDHGAGGGLFVDGGTVLIHANAITDNHAASFPGHPSSATGLGGGVAISGSLATVQDNWIVGNRGTNALVGAGGAGGGIYGLWGALRIVGNTIAENRASAGDRGSGGGVYLEQTEPWLEGNRILDNTAAEDDYGRGGGASVSDCSLFTLTNNIVARNDASELGSGIAIAYSTGQLAHNTVAENLSGDGVGVRVDYAGSDVVLTNNIIVSHAVGINNTNPAGSAVTATYTLFEGNGTDHVGVASSIEFAGPALLTADYHLGYGSTAVDQGVDLLWVTADIDGDARPFGPAPDIGADEVPVYFLPLVVRS
jgi:hypothetical protein